MKRIQIKWFKTYNILICAILSALGFSMSACRAPDEYGTPSADYIVQGKVTDSETDHPIKNIQVDMKWEKILTDTEGKYKIVINYESTGSQTFPIRFQDVDGDLNGSYMDLDTIVEFKDPKFTGGKGWYEGKTTKEFNIQLNPKE